VKRIPFAVVLGISLGLNVCLMVRVGQWVRVAQQSTQLAQRGIANTERCLDVVHAYEVGAPVCGVDTTP